MTSAVRLALLLLGLHGATGLIVPEELPTILSLIYSNIPPVKKGTDSRLGVGFRLGEHADFQILLELGPQKETDPIGNNVDSKRKRATMMIAAMKGDLGPVAQAVAQYQVEQKLKTMLERYKLAPEKPPKSKPSPIKSNEKKSDANEWLSKWSQGLGVNPDDPPVLSETSKPKVLPNVNRMRVVNAGQPSGGSHKSADVQSDLNILKKLFAANNSTETKSDV